MCVSWNRPTLCSPGTHPVLAWNTPRARLEFFLLSLISDLFAPQERLEAIYASTSEEDPSVAAAAPRARPPQAAASPEKAAGGGGGGGGAAEVEGLALKANGQKDKREAEAWKVRWPAPPAEDPPGPKEAASLQDQWEKFLAKDCLADFFPKKAGSMDCGNKVTPQSKPVARKPFCT